MANRGVIKGRGWSAPPCGSFIDWNHDHARNMIVCCLLNEMGGGGTLDLVTRKLGTILSWSPAIWRGGSFGSGMDISSAAYFPQWADATVGDLTNVKTTVDAIYSTRNTLGNGVLIRKNVATVGQPRWTLNFTGSSLGFAILDAASNGFNFTAALPSNANDGRPHHVLGTCDGATVFLYFDGRLLGSTSVTAANSTNTGFLTVGNVQGTGSAFVGTIHLARVWANRYMPASEVAALATDPYGMIIMSMRRMSNSKFFATGRRRLINIW